MVAVRVRQVGAHPGGEAAVRLLLPFLAVGLHGPPRGLGGEVVLGFEVPVEAATRQASGLHQVVQADAVEAALAEQPGGAVEDALPIGFGLLTGDFHRDLQGPAWPGT